MNSDFINTIILASLFLSLFGVAEVLYHFLKVKVEVSRKVVHIGTGLLTLLFTVMLSSHWMVLLLCASFGLILITSIKFKLLPSINAIERQSVGSIAYPVAVYGCYLAFAYFNNQHIYFFLPILILAICDPIAALTGKKWPYGKYKAGTDNKTLMGCSMFFISAFIITIALLVGMNTPYSFTGVFYKAAIIAFIAAFSEAFSRKGFDNLTIPAAVLAGMIITEKISF